MPGKNLSRGLGRDGAGLLAKAGLECRHDLPGTVEHHRQDRDVPVLLEREYFAVLGTGLAGDLPELPQRITLTGHRLQVTAGDLTHSSDVHLPGRDPVLV
jgi:hypothetical protein